MTPGRCRLGQAERRPNTIPFAPASVGSSLRSTQPRHRYAIAARSSSAVHEHPDRIAAGLGAGRAPRMRALAGGPLGMHALEMPAKSVAATALVGAGSRVGAGQTQDRTRQIGTGCPRPPGASAVRRGGAQGCRPGGLSRRLGTRLSLRRRSVGASALSFASHSIWVAGIGARAVPPAGPPGPARGATGTRAPSGRPGGRLSSGPSRPGRACSRAPCESPLGPWGSPGLPCGTRVTAISVLVRSSACRSTPWLTLERLPCSHWAADDFPPLLALPRQRVSQASRSSVLQHEGLPSRRRSLPRWVLDPSAPSQAATCHYAHSFAPRG